MTVNLAAEQLLEIVEKKAAEGTSEKHGMYEKNTSTSFAVCG